MSKDLPLKLRLTDDGGASIVALQPEDDPALPGEAVALPPRAQVVFTLTSSDAKKLRERFDA